METSQQSMQKALLATLGWLPESPARVSQSQDFGRDLVTALEAHFSLKLPELSKLNNLTLWSWRTSEGYSVTTKGKLSQLSSIRWGNWAITLNGHSLTARITEYPNTGCDGILLQDILEPNPPEQYFLSERITQKILGEQGSICHIA
jgi:hypothetical protein